MAELLRALENLCGKLWVADVEFILVESDQDEATAISFMHTPFLEVFISVDGEICAMKDDRWEVSFESMSQRHAQDHPGHISRVQRTDDDRKPRFAGHEVVCEETVEVGAYP